jgi:hypothetical protein
MLDAIERIRAAATHPLAAQLNAGIPDRWTEGTSTCAHRNTRRVTRANLSRREVGLLADAAAQSQITFA